eukprot:scaffold35411_cov56-Attheya_sp.AAC.2
MGCANNRNTHACIDKSAHFRQGFGFLAGEAIRRNHKWCKVASLPKTRFKILFLFLAFVTFQNFLRVLGNVGFGIRVCHTDIDNTVALLRELLVYCATVFAPSRDIVIGVDETKELAMKDAKIVISELGRIAHAGCSVLEWIPVAPDQSAFEWFAKAIPSSAQTIQQISSLLSAVAVSHMRSLAVARDALIQHAAPSMPSVLNVIQSRLGAKLGPCVLLCARKYVISCIASATINTVPDDLEASSDKAGAIPPVLMCLAFDLHLLVVPGKANFLEASSPNATLFKSETWYRALKFPESMKESSCSLLKSQKVEATTNKKVHYQNVCMEVDMDAYYFHPDQANHPLVDRAYVAVHPDDNRTRCLVLAQDKVNAEGFPQAVKDLNEAADLLTSRSGLTEVLLIVNVIGASSCTRSQKTHFSVFRTFLFATKKWMTTTQ